ncbi:unnamed protein product [Closterium sp. NIES-53]
MKSRLCLLPVSRSCVGPVLAWAEPTSWSGVREVQPTCSSGRAGRRGWCAGRPGAGRPRAGRLGAWSTWCGRPAVVVDLRGLPSSYNLMKRMSVMPSTWATLNEDSLTSYILRDKAMQEAERSMELLQQMNYAAPAKQGGQSGQRGQSGGCGSSGGRLTKDADKQKSAKEGGLGGGGRRWECWICHSPDHLSFECRDRSDSDDDDTKGGRGRLAGRHPRRKSKPRNERQSIKTSTSAKDAESSSGGKGRGDQEGSCSLVGVVKPTVSLAPEASEDFQAVAATMQANPAVVLLDIGCSHHLMGTKDTFVDLGPSCDFKHVHGLNGVLQDVQGRGTVALQGATEKQVLIPNVLYVPGV